MDTAAERMEFFFFRCKGKFNDILLFGSPQSWCYIAVNKWPYLIEFLRNIIPRRYSKYNTHCIRNLTLRMHQYETGEVIRE